jgi:hypothetical protein
VAKLASLPARQFVPKRKPPAGEKPNAAIPPLPPPCLINRQYYFIRDQAEDSKGV